VRVRTLWILAGTLAASQALAFKLKFGDEPLPAVRDARMPLVQRLLLNAGKETHEGLLLKTLQCAPAEAAECDRKLKDRGIDFASILRGIRWPDNPAFYLNTSPTGSIPSYCLSKGGKTVIIKPGHPVGLNHELTMTCWALTMAAGERAAREVDLSLLGGKRRNSSFALPLRSHFGDMQFLHAMAPNYQRADQSYALIRTWAKLAYETAAGKHEPEKLLKQIVEEDRALAEFKNYFVPHWRVADLFDFSDPATTDVRGIALGALLHTIQDSFAGCHAIRENVEGGTRIRQYLTYFGQGHDHAFADDDYQSVKRGLGPVEQGAKIVKALRNGSQDFDDVSAVIEEVFAPINRRQIAGPGHCASRHGES
jgi:hypothetical protein